MEYDTTTQPYAWDDETEIPPWSGFFMRLGDDLSRVGVLIVYGGDTRTHRPPDQWRVTFDEPTYCANLDAEVYLCRLK